jgi:hypothetical protein
MVQREVVVHPVLGLFGIGSGPTLLLDKSTFQRLGPNEHAVLRKHFNQNLVPVLALEILGDLAKSPPEGRSSEQVVAGLSAKFGGSGLPVHKDCSELCVQSLLGGAVPLTGEMVAAHRQDDAGGGACRGFVVTPSLLNRRLQQWSQGDLLTGAQNRCQCAAA